MRLIVGKFDVMKRNQRKRLGKTHNNATNPARTSAGEWEGEIACAAREKVGAGRRKSWLKPHECKKLGLST